MLAPNEILARVIPLVVNHLAHLHCSTDRAIRRLAHRLQPESIQSLCTVMSADALGRPPLPAVIPETITQLLQQSSQLELEVQGPRPILLGRHLLERGMTPGPRIGQVLNQAFEAQLDGAFLDLKGALAWLVENHPL